MSSKTLLLAAPAALGALLLVWALGSAREAPASTPAKAVRGRAPVSPETPAAASFPGEASAPVSAPRPPAIGGSAEAAIRSRIAELEQRLAGLGARRDAVEAENRLLDRQLAERQAQAAARATAQWRVRSWEQLLGLSEAQKPALLDLVAGWATEDAGGRASREAWGVRESELRARLSAEQSAKLSASTLTAAGRQWDHMGQRIGALATLPAAEQARIQQALGEFRAPSNALLPEAHGLEYGPLFGEAVARARAYLTPEQAARLDRHVVKN